MNYPIDSSETRQLLDRVVVGDRTAFDQLFNRHVAELKRMVQLRMDRGVQQRFDASDVIQETHFDAYRRLNEYLTRRPMPFRIWLRKNAQEKLAKMRRDHRATARRSVNRELPIPDQSSLLIAKNLLAREASPSQNLIRDEMRAKIATAVSELSEADREILLMRNAEGLSHREIGYLLEIDTVTSRKRYARALLRLRQQLMTHGVFEDNNESQD